MLVRGTFGGLTFGGLAVFCSNMERCLAASAALVAGLIANGRAGIEESTDTISVAGGTVRRLVVVV